MCQMTAKPQTRSKKAADHARGVLIGIRSPCSGLFDQRSCLIAVCCASNRPPRRDVGKHREVVMRRRTSVTFERPAVPRIAGDVPCAWSRVRIE